jgi:hypothetical protein
MALQHPGGSAASTAQIGGFDALRPALQSDRTLLFLLSAAFVLVGVYPSSPLLIIVMGGSPSTSFLIAAGFALLLTHSVAAGDVQGRFSTQLRWMIGAVAGIIVLKIIANNASVAVRELIVAAIAWLVVGLSVSQLRALLRNISYILSFFLLLSLCAAIASYYLGIINYAEWTVDYLNYLSPENPLARRSDEGRYVSFYMPLYLAVIPAYNAEEGIAFGLAFQRQNLIFQEWSYLSYFVAPLGFYVWGDRETRARAFILLLFAGTFFLTFSVWGVLVAAGTLTLLFLGKIVRSPKVIVLLGLGALAAAIAVFGITGLLALVGGNKLEQFYFFFGDKVDFTRLIRPFGVGTEQFLTGNDGGFRYYGMINIIFIYGIAGVLAFAIICLFALYLGWAALRLGKRVSPVLKFSVVSMLMVPVLGLKLSYLVPLFMLLYAALAAKLLDEAPEIQQDRMAG